MAKQQQKLHIVHFQTTKFKSCAKISASSFQSTESVDSASRSINTKEQKKFKFARLYKKLGKERKIFGNIEKKLVKKMLARE